MIRFVCTRCFDVGIPVVGRSAWRETLRQAAILAGKSQLATNLSEAFLYNMIALETVLLNQRERFPDAAVERMMALFGWLSGEDARPWKDLLTRLYSRRCELVHDGHVSGLSKKDLLETDELVINLLMNLVKNTRTIKSRKDLIALASRLHACSVLNRRPTRGMRNLRFYLRRPTIGEERMLARATLWEL